MKRIAGVAVMAAVMAVSLVAVATAHTVKYESKVTLQVKENGLEDDTFEGQVLSDRGRCVAGRVVYVFREDQQGDAHLTGAGFTSDNGEYRQNEGDAKPGTYYAVVVREVLRKSGGHTHVCEKDVSPDRVVTGP